MSWGLLGFWMKRAIVAAACMRSSRYQPDIRAHWPALPPSILLLLRDNPFTSAAFPRAPGGASTA